MGLSDITGVFSRYFVVGFFLPAYAALLSLWLAATTNFVPENLEHHSEATQLLVLGGVALFAGLLLSGVSYYIIRALEGYPLERLRGRPLVGYLYSFAIWLQLRRFNALLEIRGDTSKPRHDRNRAAWYLEQFYPHNPEALLPTRMGNAIRAFERHGNERWGLDGVTAWPRIEALLSADEQTLLVDAKIDLYVFVNGSLGALAVGACLVADKLEHGVPNSYWPLYALPFLLSYILYRFAVGLAIRWGEVVRASTDLHRLEIYERLNVRAPSSFSDERNLAVQVSKALLFAHPLLADSDWRKTAAAAAPAAAPVAGQGRAGKRRRRSWWRNFLRKE